MPPIYMALIYIRSNEIKCNNCGRLVKLGYPIIIKILISIIGVIIGDLSAYAYFEISDILHDKYGFNYLLSIVGTFLSTATSTIILAGFIEAARSTH